MKMNKVIKNKLYTNVSFVYFSRAPDRGRAPERRPHRQGGRARQPQVQRPQGKARARGHLETKGKNEFFVLFIFLRNRESGRR